MPKHKDNSNKQRKKSCPICLFKSWNRCNICYNDKCKYLFFPNKKKKKKKKIINKHVKKKLFMITKIEISYKILEDIDTFNINVSHKIGITNTRFLDIDYTWIKN